MSTVATPARAPRRRRKSTKLRRRQTRLAWLLLVPSLAVVAFVALYPLGKTVFQSFTDEQFLALEPASWVGLQNYSDLWNDTIFRDTVWTTIKFTVITVAFEFVLGLAIALIVNSSFKGRGVMRAVMLVPWAIPTVVAAQMWKSMLQSNGVISDAGVRLGILSEPHAWIADQARRSPPSAPSTSGRRRRSSRCSSLPGCRSSPRPLRGRRGRRRQPAAAVLEDHPAAARPAIFVTLIFRTLDALRVFDVFYVFFGNRLGTQSMAIYAQSTIVGDGYVGYGAAISMAIFLIIALFVVIYLTFQRVTMR